MSRPGRPPRSQQRPLTREDRALWEAVARTLEPVRKKSRVHGPSGPSLKEHGEQQVSASLMDRVETPPEVSTQSLRSSPPADRPPASREPPPLAEFDRRQARRIATGRTAIDARIDLHGMRAAEARAALRSFIFSCYARGQRNLLVITGKGDDVERRDLPFELFERSGRGVLKRSVPGWLAEPELRSIVISYTQAHPRHGGEGALYVQLRSRRTRDRP